MSSCGNIIGMIRIEPAPERDPPVATADDSTLGQLLDSFAHRETLQTEEAPEPTLLIARKRFPRSVLMADAIARADLAALVQDLDDEFAQFAEATPQ